jgi:UDP-GlcNAc:undecaprenyl-phosphate GlcNAc-1-phosphate transferase
MVFLLSGVSYSFFFSQSRVLFNPQYLGLLGSCTIGFMMGLADDAYNTRPLLKFLAQLSCGLLLHFTNTGINFFENDGLNAVITVLWVAGMMNSINMLDNMDGITTTVSIGIITCILMLVISAGDLADYDLIILTGMLAALAGFLIYNWNPSKMYMGDTGSQFLGVFLAAMSIKYLWNAPIQNNLDYGVVRNLLLVLTAFILPITDTATVVINRIARGQSPFVGGKDHTTHHLSYKGFTDKQVALIFATISFLSIILSFLLYKAELNQWLLFTLCGLFIFAVFGYLFGITRTKKAKAKAKIQAA